jgi:hypothetical protein
MHEVPIACELLGRCPVCGAPVERVAGWLALTHLIGCSLGESVRAAA